jgi:hypothetical protein
MLIYSATGVTSTPEITVTKGIAQLLVGSSLEFTALINETITVYVEKTNKNADIAREMLLKDFILLGSYGVDTVHALTGVAASALVDLTKDNGFINLIGNEVIKVKLGNLTAGSTYHLYGIEGFFPTVDLFSYETKTMSSDVLNQDFDVIGYDLICITKDNTITEFALTHETGAILKLLPIELEAIQKSLDPFEILDSGNLVKYDTTRYIIPLNGIKNVNIRKTIGVTLRVNLRIDENDAKKYELNRS